MLKKLLYIALIVILAFIALRIALPLIGTLIAWLISAAILVLAIVGILYLVNKLKST
jgi:uncharacterized membrane protein (DUF485 family)